MQGVEDSSYLFFFGTRSFSLDYSRKGGTRSARLRTTMEPEVKPEFITATCVFVVKHSEQKTSSAAQSAAEVWNFSPPQPMHVRTNDGAKWSQVLRLSGQPVRARFVQMAIAAYPDSR